jgi:hypothetical protein
MAGTVDQVQEVQGLYGPFTLAERVVQKIWMRRDFELATARLVDGRVLEVLRAGQWNLLAGPDFRGARLRIGGREVSGDVEVHFHAADWHAHGHDSDRAYDGVVLHVVMFPPTGAVACSRTGDPLPTLVLLPLLNRGLEEYAADDALETLTARDAAARLAGLSTLPREQMIEELRARARRRWEQKVNFARKRIERLGWTAAAHHAALEILGYRRNRAPMLAVAARYPLEAWVRGINLDEVYREGADHWQTHGVRPANHPLARLRQYGRWIASVPAWPGNLVQQFEPLVAAIADGCTTRAQLRLARLRSSIASRLAGDVLVGTRLDNLICDGVLPLLAADSGKNVYPGWFQWYVGDVPIEVRRGLGALGLAGGGAGPQCHGWAQGLLGWIIERDESASG